MIYKGLNLASYKRTEKNFVLFETRDYRLYITDKSMKYVYERKNHSSYYSKKLQVYNFLLRLFGNMNYIWC